MLIWLDEVNTQIGTPLQCDAYVNNLPSPYERCHLLDGKLQGQNQFHLGTRIGRVRYLNDGDRVSLPQQVNLDMPVVLQVMAKRFRKYVATSDSFQNRANMQQRCAST